MSQPFKDRGIDRRGFVAAAAMPAVGGVMAGIAKGENQDDKKKVAKPKPSLQLHVVGNGCPAPTPEHYGSSFILEFGSECLMVDCGPATTYKMTLMGIPLLKVGHVFLTHHHFDHNVDFPCFALTRWDQSKCTERPLKVYGPPPTQIFVQRLLGEEGAFVDDWKSRVEHPVSLEIFKRRGGVLPRPAPAVEAKDVAPGKIAEGESWAATATHVHHVEPGLESLAYRFDTDHGSIVFAADCGDCHTLRELARGADTLVIGCVYVGHSERYSDIVTGSGEAADIAQAAGVRRLILSHAAPGFSKPEMKQKAIADAAQTFKGKILFPGELTTVDLIA